VRINVFPAALLMTCKTTNIPAQYTFLLICAISYYCYPEESIRSAIEIRSLCATNLKENYIHQGEPLILLPWFLFQS